MAADQRRLAHAGKRDSTSMKTISLLGAIFLPATLLASVFSMVFFNVGSGTNNSVWQQPERLRSSLHKPHPPPLPPPTARHPTKCVIKYSLTDQNLCLAGFTIAPTVWIYFVITIPVTVVIVLTWWVWDRTRERRYAREDIDLEDQIDGMESKIMATMRRRTMNKVRTWTQAPEKVE